MDDSRRFTEEDRTSADEVRRLRALLEEREEVVRQLNAELAETNKGVVVLYSELDDKNLALREVSELKSRFLSYMSHEFRTPLGAIRSLARLLLNRMDGPLTSEQDRQVGFILQSAIDLNQMVDDLLDLAKIEAGRVSISAEWFEMMDLFTALRGMFKPILDTEDVNLIFEESTDIPTIFTDNKKLSQILRNYISNALKFTPTGSVRVTARREGNDEVTFSVIDTGIGIASEHHATIFKDFMQIDSLLQRKWRGTGLGLSLSKKLAELLGGRVGMKSEVDVGSTFWVTIPIQYQDGSDHAAVLPERPAAGERQSHVG